MGRGEPDEAKVAELMGQLNLKLDAYEKILSKQPYLGGQVRGAYLSSVTIVSFRFRNITDIYAGRLISFALWYVVGSTRRRRPVQFKTPCQEMVGEDIVKTFLESCSRNGLTIEA